MTPAPWEAAMREAVASAQSPDAPHGENPRVGCVIVDTSGRIVGRGHHRGAGTAHAEVVALADAGDLAAGSTAVVSMEPCRHTGRTGPCTTALVNAGIVRVVYGQADPTAEGGGGGRLLADAGVEVVAGLLAAEAEAVNTEWTFAVRAGRPFVTWKAAVTLDGRVAGPGGGPTAITGPAAVQRVHELRSRVGAIIVGTGTALADDPALTVRLEGSDGTHRPLRVVVGSRALPSGARVTDGSAPTLLVDDRDPGAVLSTLYDRGVRHALLEGGPTLAAAFVEARLIDRVVWYVAPLLLGSGPVALPAISTGAAGVAVEAVSVVGEDVCIEGRVQYEGVGL